MKSRISPYREAAVRVKEEIPLYELEVDDGVIRTIQDFSAVTHELLSDGYPDGSAVAIKAGAIDRTVFPFDRLSIVNHEAASARFHAHLSYEVALTPENNKIPVSTLISTKEVVIDTLRRLLSAPSTEQKMREKFDPKSLPLYDEFLKKFLQTSPYDDAYLLYHGLNQNLFDVQSYPLYRFMQEQLQGQLVEVPWTKYDVCLLLKQCIHARDVRERDTRETKTQLRFINPNRASKKPVQ